MALIEKAATGVSLASTLPANTSMVTGLLTSVALVAGDIITINATNEWIKVPAGGTPEIVCMTLVNASVGDPVTGWHHVTVRYGDAIPISGIRGLFIDAAVAGGISNTQLDGAVPLGFIVDAQRIYFHGGIINTFTP